MIVAFYKWLHVLVLPFVSLAVPPTFSKAHAHPFYVSVVEINHNKSNALLEISCKLFAEDAETTLEQQYKTPIDLSQPQQKGTIDRLLNDYVQKHLALQADKKAQTLRYVGFEREAESLYCYFEVDNLAAVKTIDITNSLLYDFTDKQINIMHVVVDGVRKSFKLDYPNTQTTFSF